MFMMMTMKMIKMLTCCGHAGTVTQSA